MTIHLSHPSLSPRVSLICLYSSCVLPLHGRLQKEESRAELWGDLGAEEGASAGSGSTVEGQVHGQAAWCGGKNSGFGARGAWVLTLSLLPSL